MLSAWLFEASWVRVSLEYNLLYVPRLELPCHCPLSPPQSLLFPSVLLACLSVHVLASGSLQSTRRKLMVSHGLPAQTPRKQRFSSVPRDLSVSGTQRCFVDAREVLFPRRQLLEASFLHIMPLAPWSGRRRLCLAVPRSGGPFSSSSDRGIEEMALGLPPCTQTFSLPVTVHPLVLAMVPGEAADLTFFFFPQRARP